MNPKAIFILSRAVTIINDMVIAIKKPPLRKVSLFFCGKSAGMHEKGVAAMDLSAIIKSMTYAHKR